SRQRRSPVFFFGRSRPSGAKTIVVLGCFWGERRRLNRGSFGNEAYADSLVASRLRRGNSKDVMSYKNLQEALDSARSPVDMLRNSQIGPYAFPVVPSEFTNWRDEQRSWRETCALFDQSHHMTDLYLEGPDALKLIAATGVNTFGNFRVDTAKQFVACNHDGYVIGDAILFHLAQNSFVIVGRPPALNWAQYNLEAGSYNVRA